MVLRPESLLSIPEHTVRVARAAHRTGSVCMRIRDELGPVFADEAFAELYSHRGQPAVSPARLAMVLVLQFAEGLTDRQAADQVRSRIDWKYALGLELTDPGFDASVLTEFRVRLLDGQAAQRLLDTLLTQLRAKDLLKPGGKARTDSTHVLAAVRLLNRLENLAETIRAALEAIAGAAPDWLRSWVPGDWFDRYQPRLDSYRLPKSETQRRALAIQIGADGWQLWTAITSSPDMGWLARLPALEILRRTWVQQFFLDPTGRVRPRDPKDQGLPPGGLRLDSPHDPEARTSVKRDTVFWSGYRAHLTETCDPDRLHVITHVATTPAPVPDLDMIGPIHHDLATAGLLPALHIVDGGYLDAATLVTSHTRHQVELLGPTRPDTSWQAKAGKGFAAASFPIDFDKHTATCPQGATSSSWGEHTRPNGEREIHIKFRPSTCAPCPARTDCTTATTGPRQLTLRTRTEHEAITQARIDQSTPEWKRRYDLRAGVEGTISQAVRAFGLRRTRYIGLAKTHLQHILTAIAINLTRLNSWLLDTPHGTTRTTRFQTLRTAA
jgi:transposase